MQEFVGRFLVAALGEALGAALLALLDVLPRPVRTLLRIVAYLVVAAAYLVTFVVCALTVVKAEYLWLRMGAGLLGAFCFVETASLMRKALNRGAMYPT